MTLVKEIIMYLLELSNGFINGKTKLARILYLLNYEYFRKKKILLMELKFKNSFFGPYIVDFDQILNELVKEKYIKITQIESLFEPYFLYRIELLNKPNYIYLDEKLKHEIEDIFRRYISMNLNDLIDVVFETDLCINTDFGEIINFKATIEGEGSETIPLRE